MMVGRVWMHASGAGAGVGAGSDGRSAGTATWRSSGPVTCKKRLDADSVGGCGMADETFRSFGCVLVPQAHQNTRSSRRAPAARAGRSQSLPRRRRSATSTTATRSLSRPRTCLNYMPNNKNNSFLVQLQEWISGGGRQNQKIQLRKEGAKGQVSAPSTPQAMPPSKTAYTTSTARRDCIIGRLDELSSEVKSWAMEWQGSRRGTRSSRAVDRRSRTSYHALAQACSDPSSLSGLDRARSPDLADSKGCCIPERRRDSAF